MLPRKQRAAALAAQHTNRHEGHVCTPAIRLPVSSTSREAQVRVPRVLQRQLGFAPVQCYHRAPEAPVWWRARWEWWWGGVDVALFGEEVRCRQVVEYNGCASDRVGPAERRAESGPRSAAGMAAPGMGFGGRRGSKHECQIAKNAHGDE